MNTCGKRCSEKVGKESLRRPLLSSLQITVRRVTNVEKSPRLYMDVFAQFNHQNKETIIFES